MSDVVPVIHSLETAQLRKQALPEFRAGDTVAEAPVWLGAQDKVPLIIPKAVMVTTPAGQPPSPRVVARFEGPIPAPIAKGTKIGTAVIDMRYENPLYMAEDAGAADLIAGGRLQLGISRGSPEQVVDGWRYFDYEPTGGETDSEMGHTAHLSQHDRSALKAFLGGL